MQIKTRGVFLAVGILLALTIGPEMAISSFSIPAAHKVKALLNPKSSIADLPQQVTITVDGVTATYTQGTDAYDQLLALLRLRHSDGAEEQAGPISTGSVSSCGQLTIRRFGLPFRCKLTRSTANPNYMRIAIPYANSNPDVHFPLIIDYNRLGSFVRNR
jgi:hypothetical protein